MLKIFKETSNEHDSASILLAYNGRGAVRVLATHPAGEALLLEQVMPATDLAALVKQGKDAEATRLFCTTARQLHQAPVVPEAKDLAVLHSRFAAYLAQPLPSVPCAWVTRAAELWQRLVDSTSERVLLHGDLHHENILLSDTRGWLAIDPKGYHGDPAFEVAPFLKNPMQLAPSYYATPERLMQRVSIIARQLQLSPERLIQWGFAYSILSCLWAIDDGVFSDEWMAIPEVLATMT